MSIFDQTYTSQIGGATQRRDDTLAQLGFAVGPDGKLIPLDSGQRQRLRLQYGYDATGNVDLSNPFGQAALLQKSYDQSKKSTTGQLASRGQLYSGYHQSKQAGNLNNFQQGSNRLKTSYDEAQGGLLTAGLGALHDYGDTATAAYAAWMDRNPPAPVPAAPAANPFPGVSEGLAKGLDPSLAPHVTNDMLAAMAKYGRNNVKLTNTGLYYRRQSDGKWIPIKG